MIAELADIEEPKSCPFCGSTPSTGTYLSVHGESTEYAFCACTNKACQVRPKVGSTHSKGQAEQAAIRRWNIRA
jgi:formate dehydrogenase maturation protein FdhE